VDDHDEDRAAFEQGFRDLRVLYEALEPDDFLRDCIRPYTWLTKLYMTPRPWRSRRRWQRSLESGWSRMKSSGR